MQTFINRYAGHYRALVSLGVPIVVGQIGNIILGFADTLMVGHYGMKELAAASFVNNIFMLFIIFAMGFSYGLTPIIGNKFGRGEHDGIGGVVRNGLLANTVLAAIIVAVLTTICLCLDRLGQPDELLPLMRPYMVVNIVSIPFVCWLNTFKQFYDAIGDTKTPMYILICGNILNIFGNYVLIFGEWGFPEWGLFGAGVSTAFSRVMMALVAMGVFFGAKHYNAYATGFKTAKLDVKAFRHINGLGWPLALQMGMETAAFSVSAVFVGWIGTTALAAHQIMITVSQTFYMVYYGMAAAVAVRVSYFHGQRNLKAVKLTANAGFHLILVIAVCASVPIFLLRNSIGLWFTDNAEVCALVAQTVIPLIVYQFGDGLQCTFANALRGVSHVKPMMLIAFFSYFVVSLPLGWFLGLRCGIGLVGVWCAFPVCLTCAGVLYYTCFRRKLKSEWGRGGMLALSFAIAFLVSVGAEAKPPKANIAVGVNHRTADSLLFSSVNVGLFGNVDTLRGVQLDVFTSVARREMRGVNVGGFAAIGRGRSYGVTIGGLMTAVDGDMRGLQAAGVANIARRGNGVQIAGLTNASTSPFRGVQLSGVTNISMGVKRGIQLSAMANICSASMRGLQFGTYNYADTLSGSQIGLINVCVHHPRGLQIGLINYSRDTVAHKIGLVNVNPRTRIDLVLSGSNCTKMNLAIRFRNRSTYNVLGVGTHYFGLDEHFSGALFYRIGQYFALSPRWSVSGDVGFYHIESFQENSTDKPERLYSLQARLNADYAIGRYVGAFATVGYGDTRYYYHSRSYRQRAIVEAGLTFRLVRK